MKDPCILDDRKPVNKSFIVLSSKKLKDFAEILAFALKLQCTFKYQLNYMQIFVSHVYFIANLRAGSHLNISTLLALICLQ